MDHFYGKLSKCNIHWVFGHVGFFVFFRTNFHGFERSVHSSFATGAPFDFWYMFFRVWQKSGFRETFDKNHEARPRRCTSKKVASYFENNHDESGDFGTAKWRKQKDPKEIGGNVSPLEALKKNKWFFVICGNPRCQKIFSRKISPISLWGLKKPSCFHVFFGWKDVKKPRRDMNQNSKTCRFVCGITYLFVSEWLSWISQVSFM